MSVCSATTICAAATSGSTLRCGIAPCPPRPRTRRKMLVGAGEERSGLYRDIANGGLAPDVQADDAIHVGIAQHAVVEHGLRPGGKLLRRLERELDVAGELIATRAPAGRPESARW